MTRFRHSATAAIFALLALCGVSPAPSPSPAAREKLSEARWTGPMLAPSAGTLPRGHVLIEPYLFDVMQYGSYDRSGALTRASHSNSFGSLTYIIYGLTDRFNVGMIPVFGFTTVNNGLSSSGIQVGDLALLAQYRISQYRIGSRAPTASINVQETFPTGRYDRLGDRPANGFGSGTYTTTVSLYTQTYFWMPSGRILRARLNLSQAFSNTVSVDGVSVYGTSERFHGTAKPGKAFTFDAAAEYSITSNWVAALDLVYHRSGNTKVIGSTGVTNSGSSEGYELAPAIEYNWTPNVGILVGVRTIPAGFNTSATVTPAIAINIVH